MAASLTLVTLALGTFMTLAVDVWAKEAFPFDAAWLNLLFALRASWLTALAQGITATGETTFIAVIVIVLSLALWQRRRLDVLAIWVTVGGSTLFNNLLKLFFARPRPSLHPALAHALGYSFPSGHSMAALAFYGIIGYLAGRYLAPPWRYVAYGVCVLWIILVGLSRNYLGVHYPSDVLAAYAVTLPWLLAVIYYHHCLAEETPLETTINSQS